MNTAPHAIPPCVLAIDQGSHASRALLIDAAGCVRARASVPVGMRSPHPGWAEHDADELVASVRLAIEAVLARPGVAGLEIAAAGLATQRSSIACWDRETGVALSPVISWQDRRHAAWLDALRLEPAWLHDVTGLVASPHYGASKLRWCVDHLPEVRAAAAAGSLCCGPLASFLVDRLVTRRTQVADPANASRTLLWDLRSGDWSPPLLERFGIEARWLPRCVPSRHAFGRLALAGRDLPLTVVTGDQSAALFAWGAPAADILYVNVGTGAFVQRAFAGEPPPAAGLLRSVAWRDDGDCVTVLEGTVNGAGAALAWLAQARGVEPESVYDTIEAGGQDPPLFLNYIGGLGSPWWQAEGVPRFTREVGLAEAVAAVIESIAFMLYANIEAIESAAQAGAGDHGPARRIVLTGGLAHIERLGQSLADLAGLALVRPAEVEATAQGLGVHLGVAAQDIAAAAGRAAPRRNDALRGRYRAWCRAISE